MRIGMLGGTFDPPHVGHILAASDAYEALGLDRVMFVPAAQQPLKQLPNGPAGAQSKRASAPDRLEMVRLAIADDSRFRLCAIEIDRGGLSYTIDTLRELARNSSGDTRFLLVGADVLATFAQWREPVEILRLATLGVFMRAVSDGGGARASWAGILAQLEATHGRSAGHEPVFLESRRVDVSSTEVRERVATGRSIHGFVPDAVASYIATRRLYC